MKAEVVIFEPSSKAGTFTLEVPEGARILLARKTPLGHGHLVLAVPDTPTGKKVPVKLAALYEDNVRGPIDGDPHEWRPIGCWSYDSGGYQHLFVHEPVQVLELSESVATSIEDLTARVEKLEQAPAGKKPKATKDQQPAPAGEPEKDPG